MQDLNGLETGVMAGAMAAGGFLFKWAWDRLWRSKDGADAAAKKAAEDARLAELKQRDDQHKEMKSLVTGLGTKVDAELREMQSQMNSQFGELRQMMNKRDVDTAKLEVKVEAQEKAIDDIRDQIAKIPEMITASRHTLRNELTQEWLPRQMAARKAGAALQDTARRADPPGVIVTPPPMAEDEIPE